MRSWWMAALAAAMLGGAACGCSDEDAEEDAVVDAADAGEVDCGCPE